MKTDSVVARWGNSPTPARATKCKKLRNPSKEAALLQIEALYRDGQRKPGRAGLRMHPYRCPACSRETGRAIWHVGHGRRA